jgi:hypothetical protein
VYRSGMPTPATPSSPDGPSPRCCPRCGADMEERKCKIVCLNCGAMADCSDP